MKLKWTDKETVFIPNVGTVGQGTVFDIEDERGQDLLNRGAAKLVSSPVSKESPAPTPEPKVKTNIQEGTVKRVVIADSIMAGDR